MSRQRDIDFGRHSRIPECCIKFFVDEWDCEKESVHRRNMDKGPTWNYVPCPECLAAGNKVHIRYCEIECHRECWRDF